MPRHVRILPYFGIGNQLFQYMLALAIEKLSGEELVKTGYNIPEFNLCSASNPAAQAVRVAIQNHIVPLCAIANLVKCAKHIDVDILSLSCRMSYYEPFLSLYQERILPHSVKNIGFGGEYLVINVRGNEIMAGIHPHYTPLPLAFYRQIIEESGLTPVFMGQIVGHNLYSANLRSSFPRAIFVPSNGPAEDFWLLSRSENILLSISTFAWLAAWLSPAARNIYLPIAGLYSPRIRPDIDLLPVNDSRYHFYDLNLPSWDGSEAAMAEMVSQDTVFCRISANQIKAQFAHLVGHEGLQIHRPPLT